MGQHEITHGLGIDIGKTHHWVSAVDIDGKRLLSVKAANDEAEIRNVIATRATLAQQPIWAVDIIGAPSALLLALLAQAGQTVRYTSGRVVAAMSAAYVGEGKTVSMTCATARLLGDISGVNGCRDHNLVDCATLVPVGKALRGGELAWDGTKWIRRFGKPGADFVHVDKVAARIANGHGFEKHLRAGELPRGVTTRSGYAAFISDAIRTGHSRTIRNGTGLGVLEG